MKLKKKVMISTFMIIFVIISGSFAYALLDNTDKEIDMPNTQGTNGEQSNTTKIDRPIILEFINDCCNDVYVDPFNKSQLGIKEITWINETTVNILAYVSTNCAYWIEGAGFHIYNNKISLTYYIGKTDLIAYCICAHGLSFTLSNLEPGEYNFELESTIINHI